MRIYTTMKLCVPTLVCLAILGCQGPGTTEKVASTGFPADVRAATLRVNGMSCPLCAHNIDQQLMRVPGVQSVFVNLGKGEVTVGLSDVNPPNREQLAKAIAASGFSLVGVAMDTGATVKLCSTCECKNCSCAIATQRCLSACSCH